MTFLNPLFLFGLAAAALPLLIHLLNLRKLNVVEFSSLRFLKELQRTQIRRVKVRQILLLILRTLLVIFIVLAFSRPAMQGNVAGFATPAARSAMVIVLDDSPSMSLRTQQGALFSRARETADRIMALAGPGDKVRLITLSESTDPGRISRGLEPGEVLSSLEPSDQTVPFSDAVSTFRAILDASPEINKELFLITDLQKTQFTMKPPDTAAIPTTTNLFCIAIDGGERIENRGVTDVSSSAQVVTTGRVLTYTAKVSNSSDRPVDNLLLSVYLAGSRAAQRSVAVPPGGEVFEQVEIVPRASGILTGVVELEDDQMEADNRRYFTLFVPSQVRVALIGTPKETEYLRIALAAAGSAGLGNLFMVDRLDESRVGSIDLSRYDVLVLSGVRDLTGEEGRRLRRFVGGGGGLAFFPGPATDFTSMNGSLLKELGIPAITGVEGTRSDGTGSLRFGNVETAHPIFSGLFEERIGRNEATIESPRIKQTLRFAPGGSGDPLITLSDGAPFLVDYRIDGGRVLVCATDAALAWSDLAVTGLFAPLIHRAVMYLETASAEDHGVTAGTPASVSLRTPAEQGFAYTVTTPDGLSERVTPDFNPLTGMTTFDIPGTRDAGVYALYREGAGTAPVAAIAVNIDPAETDMERIGEKEAADFFRAAGFDADRIRFAGADDELDRFVRESRYGVELWKTMVAIALFLALVEMAVARTRKAETGGGEEQA